MRSLYGSIIQPLIPAHPRKSSSEFTNNICMTDPNVRKTGSMRQPAGGFNNHSLNMYANRLRAIP